MVQVRRCGGFPAGKLFVHILKESVGHGMGCQEAGLMKEDLLFFDICVGAKENEMYVTVWASRGPP